MLSYQLPRGRCQPPQAPACGGTLHRGLWPSLEYFCTGKGEKEWLEGAKDHLVSPPKLYHSRRATASKASSIHSLGLLENRIRCRSSGQSQWRDHKRHKVFGGNRGDSSNATYGTPQAHLTITSVAVRSSITGYHKQVGSTRRR